MHSMTERFTAALHTIDSDRDVGPMVELIGDDAQLVTLDERHETSGKDGAKVFWEDDRNVFGDLETRFTGAASAGRSRAGGHAYRGVRRRPPDQLSVVARIATRMTANSRCHVALKPSAIEPGPAAVGCSGKS